MENSVNAAVLSGLGLNCEYETAHALKIGGANSKIVHFSSFLKNPSLFEEFQIFFIPGGWSFADDIQSGRVLANKFKFKLQKPLKRFVDEGKPVVGICNGFQVLVQLGVLPGWEDWNAKKITLMHNRSGRFEDRWIRLRTENSACKFAQGMEAQFILPVRHGEGQIVLADLLTLNKLNENKQIAFRYAGKDGMKSTAYPENPNGSADGIAGICNEAGNVLGMMPHPECHIRYLQNPFWTSNPPSKIPSDLFTKLKTKLGVGPKSAKDTPNCMPFFENIVELAKKH
ncbi:MAG: phosphoribosylformylglycinamidine synthase I [Candidatus Micrarchaeota archaeon]